MEKQETPEEAAENYASKKLQRPITIYTPLESNVAEYVSFIKGAKYQQEQDKKMYSEEEVRNIIFKFSSDFDTKRNIEITLEEQKEWLKQFKNK